MDAGTVRQFKGYQAFIRGLMGSRDACWLWRGACDDKGYARIGKDAKNDRASREAWRLFVGPIPAGAMVLHHCDNRACVNPRHLYLGTHQDNMRDIGLRNRGHNSKLTAEQVQAIRLLRRQGTSHKVIAEQFGIDRTTSVKICNGSRRQHVPTSAVTSD